MSATTDRPARVQVIESWTGGDADLLRQSLRMTNESFAEYLGVAVRTVACWRKQPGIIPRPAIQETLDAALERAPDRARAQFACCWQSAASGQIARILPEYRIRMPPFLPLRQRLRRFPVSGSRLMTSMTCSRMSRSPASARMRFSRSGRPPSALLNLIRKHQPASC